MEQERKDIGSREPEEPLDAVEAGEYLKMHPKTVQRLAREGKIAGHRMPGMTRWLFFKSELHNALLGAVSSTDCPCRS